jgi:hypothetical protein
MAFGLMIGACFLTLIGMIPARGHRNGLVNTLIVGHPSQVIENDRHPWG